MNVLLFCATGMVGQGVLRECLLDPDVQVIQTVGRTATGVQHTKLKEVVQKDLYHTPQSKRTGPASTRASSAWASPRRA
jgi:hypothetical protein